MRVYITTVYIVNKTSCYRLTDKIPFNSLACSVHVVLKSHPTCDTDIACSHEPQRAHKSLLDLTVKGSYRGHGM